MKILYICREFSDDIFYMTSHHNLCVKIIIKLSYSYMVYIMHHICFYITALDLNFCSTFSKGTSMKQNFPLVANAIYLSNVTSLIW